MDLSTPEPTPEQNPQPVESSAPVIATAPQPVATYLHTWLFLLLIFIEAAVAAYTFAHAGAEGPGGVREQSQRYISTIIWQLVMFALVAFGVRHHGTKIKDVIGGAWNSFEDFLLDAVIAIVFWFASAIVTAGIGFLLDPSAVHNAQKNLKAVAAIAPQTIPELSLFILLACTAGFVEEFVFRGYLQKQFSAMTKNVWAGVFISGAFFGTAHMYQGPTKMVQLGLYGMMFGLLAHFRKSTRSGMMAHAFQDSIAGVLLYIAATHPELIPKS